ncbi:TPA: acyltransferase [Photobacterium damselae]
MSFYTQKELKSLGFRFVGENVLISRKASFYGVEKISIDDNSRIDDFCVLSSSDKGEINIGRNVHIAIYSSLIGKESINIKNFSNISSRVSIYSSSDDFSGNWMTNPTIPDNFTNVVSKKVVIGENVIIGAGCIILPGVTINNGCAVGAMSLIKDNFPKNSIIMGVPGRIVKKRNTGYEKLCNQFLNS